MKGLILGSAFFFLIQALFVKPTPMKRSDYLTPPQVIKNLSAGLQVQFSDSFWMRAIQDFDFCDQPLNEKECKGQSWLFHVIDLTTDLDGRFLDAYFYGALALSVIISDSQGASRIFDKGVVAFPKEWLMTYAAAYHALYEEKDKLKAARLYAMAADHGAPAWVRVMAGRLALEGGEKEFAEKVLQQMLLVNEDPKLIERLKQKMGQNTAN